MMMETSKNKQHTQRNKRNIPTVLTTPSRGLIIPGNSLPNEIRWTSWLTLKTPCLKGCKSCTWLCALWKLFPGAKWKLPATCNPLLVVVTREHHNTNLVDKQMAINLTTLSALLFELLGESLPNALQQKEYRVSERKFQAASIMKDYTCSMFSAEENAQPFFL